MVTSTVAVLNEAGPVEPERKDWSKARQHARELTGIRGEQNRELPLGAPVEELGRAGVGVVLLFKTIKWLQLLFGACTVLSLPCLAHNLLESRPYADSLSYIVQTSLVSVSDERLLAGLQAVPWVAQMALVLAFGVFLRAQQRRVAQSVDTTNVTTSDYALEVGGLPPHRVDEAALTAFFAAEGGAIRQVEVSYACEQYARACARVQRFAETITELATDPDGASQEWVAERRVELQARIDADAARLRWLQQQKAPTGAVFVVFELAADRDACRRKLAPGWAARLLDSVPCLRGVCAPAVPRCQGVRVRVEGSPDPSDVFWENLEVRERPARPAPPARVRVRGVGASPPRRAHLASRAHSHPPARTHARPCCAQISRFNRRLRSARVLLASAALIAVTFAILFVMETRAKELAERRVRSASSGSVVEAHAETGVTVAAAVVVTAINGLLKFVSPRLAASERQGTRSAVEVSVLSKLGLAYVINQSVLILLVKPTTRWAGNGNAFEQAFYIAAANALLPELAKMVRPDMRLKRLLGGLLARTHQGLLRTHEPPLASLGALYAGLLRTVAVAIIFGPVVPLVWPTSVLALEVAARANRYSLLRVTRQGAAIDDGVSERFRELLPWLVAGSLGVQAVMVAQMPTPTRPLVAQLAVGIGFVLWALMVATPYYLLPCCRGYVEGTAGGADDTRGMPFSQAEAEYGLPTCARTPARSTAARARRMAATRAHGTPPACPPLRPPAPPCLPLATRQLCVPHQPIHRRLPRRREQVARGPTRLGGLRSHGAGRVARLGELAARESGAAGRRDRRCKR